jgi:hypothetical protein
MYQDVSCTQVFVRVLEISCTNMKRARTRQSARAHGMHAPFIGSSEISKLRHCYNTLHAYFAA